MSVEVRSLSRALLIAWMGRETPPAFAPRVRLELAEKHDGLNTASEAEAAKSYVPPVVEKDGAK